jgi:hypothetical protein
LTVWWWCDTVTRKGPESRLPLLCCQVCGASGRPILSPGLSQGRGRGLSLRRQPARSVNFLFDIDITITVAHLHSFLPTLRQPCICTRVAKPPPPSLGVLCYYFPWLWPLLRTLLTLLWSHPLPTLLALVLGGALCRRLCRCRLHVAPPSKAPGCYMEGVPAGAVVLRDSGARALTLKAEGLVCVRSMQGAARECGVIGGAGTIGTVRTGGATEWVLTFPPGATTVTITARVEVLDKTGSIPVDPADAKSRKGITAPPLPTTASPVKKPSTVKTEAGTIKALEVPLAPLRTPPAIKAEGAPHKSTTTVKLEVNKSEAPLPPTPGLPLPRPPSLPAPRPPALPTSRPPSTPKAHPSGAPTCLPPTYTPRSPADPSRPANVP